jgi:phosphoserine phosphatase
MSREIAGKVAVFDVEGVLIPKNRLFFELAKNKSFYTLVKVCLIGLLYELGILKLESALKSIFKNLRGTKLSTMERIFQQIPATPQLGAFMEELHLRNYQIVLISSGLPTFLVKRLADCIGADDAYGIDLEVHGESITGKISGDAIEPRGKLKICQRILKIESLPPNNVVVVADDRNNSCLFLPNVRKIAFNPDFILRIKADFVVCGKLSAILPVIDGQRTRWHFPSRNDLVREDIHASGFFVPVIAS